MNKLIVLLCLALFAAPASAVGTLIVATYYGVSLTAAGLATFTYGMSVAAMAINFAVSSLVGRVFGPKPPKARDNGVRQQIPPATNNSLPIVYGDAYTGGVYVDAALSQNQKTMYYVLVVSSVSPNGQFSFDQTKFYYGDQLITFDGTDQTKVVSLTDGSGDVRTAIDGKLFINLYVSNATGTITSLNGAPAPHVVMKYDAADKTTVPSSLAWPSSGRQMNGLAFAIVKLVYNQDAGTTQLQPVTFHCSQYLNSTGVAKPGDVWLDYITNTLYGGAVASEFVDSASAAALNTYADQTITFTPSGGGTSTQPRYRINGVLDTGSNCITNINKILDACDSWMAYDAANGKWSIVINKAESSSFAFNDSNIIGDIRVSTLDINQSINQIEAQFPNKLNKDIPAYIQINTPTGLLFPNEPVNKASVTLDLVNDNVQAYYLANRQLEQAREDLIVKITTTYVGIQINAGDVISITNAAYGWTSKLFRVTKVNEASLPDGNLGAQIECAEYNAQVYDDKDITAFTPIPNSDIPNIGNFGTLTAPVVSDQLPNAAVPTFSVDCTMPSLGQITMVTLYYTTATTPSATDWIIWSIQSASNSEPFDNGSTVKFPHINLPTGTYKFAFTVGNSSNRSVLSPASAAYTWLPNPSSSAVAGTFIASFSPPILAVPYSGTTATFTGLAPQLYGTTAGGSVDFVASQTDSDSAFVANTWRIGGSSTTGYADIVKSGITISDPSDAGFYALWPAPTAMSTNPATLSVPVRYKAADGTVYQGATAVLQFTYAVQGGTGSPGTPGTKSAIAYLYQWSTATPSNPNGNSIFDWGSSSNTSYSGGNGWTTNIPANPGTPGIKLWQAAKGVSDTVTAASTTVSWSSGFAVSDITQNGAAGSNGTQAARPTVYQWAATIPSAPSGSSTYTWSSGTFTPTPAGWTLSPGTGTPGFTLWAAQVSLIESATTATSTINWTTASVFAAGYAGQTGASARVMYSRIAGSPTPTAGTVTVSGDNRPTGAQASAVWGVSFNVTWSANDPLPSSNNTLWQADGIYNPATGNTSWSTPYISNLKVGALSAITTNTGDLTVTGTITAQSGATPPEISGTTMTGAGAEIYSDGRFVFGDASKNLNFNGSVLTMNGDLVVTGNIVAEGVTSTRAFLSTTSTNISSSSFSNVTMGGVAVSVTLTATSGSAAVITVSIDGTVGSGGGLSATAEFRVTRNGTALSGTPSNTFTLGGGSTFTFTFVDTSPTVGANVYTLQARNSSATAVSVALGSMVGTVLKR